MSHCHSLSYNSKYTSLAINHIEKKYDLIKENEQFMDILCYK